MYLAQLFLNSKMLIFLSFYLMNSIQFDLKKYDIIIAIPNNSNAKLQRQKRVPETTLDTKKYSIGTEIPDEDNFDYSFKAEEDDQIYYDYGKELTTMKQPIQKTGIRNNYYNGLPTNRDITVAKPNSKAFDFSKEYSFEEDYSDEYKAIEGDDRIVGGIEVDISRYPYHVEYGFNCGGAIIDKKWILTAGHCGSGPYITVGSNHRNKGKLHVIKNYYVHPKWAARSKEHIFDYDFQLLELSRPLKFSNLVQPVKVGRMSDLVIGNVITVTGRGSIKENGPISMILQAVQVPIIPKNVCQRVRFPHFQGQLTPRMFCAGYKEGGKDSCQGDSGGPAVANKRLLGIVSFGYGCAVPGSYGVYSNVPAVRSWIKKTTGLTLK